MCDKNWGKLTFSARCTCALLLSICGLLHQCCQDLTGNYLKVPFGIVNYWPPKGNKRSGNCVAYITLVWFCRSPLIIYFISYLLRKVKTARKVWIINQWVRRKERWLQWYKNQTGTSFHYRGGRCYLVLFWQRWYCNKGGSLGIK